MPDTDAPDAVTLAMRVDDTPPYVPGSEEETCGGCGAEVWISPATRESIDRGEYPDTIRCTRCVTGEADDE